MQLFFSQDIQSDSVFLSEEESRHIKVLRKQIGDTIWVTDGKGNLYQTQLKILAKKCELEIVEIEKKIPATKSIHLIVAPTKNLDRMEWMVEKCCEIGIQKISFINCQRSERKFLKINRLEKKALSALKQSKQYFLTSIEALDSYKSVLNTVPDHAIKFIAHCEDSTEKLAFKNHSNEGEYVILIGPEGDFTHEEVHQAKEKGFSELHLGESILRTETAAMVAVALLRNS